MFGLIISFVNLPTVFRKGFLTSLKITDNISKINKLLKIQSLYECSLTFVYEKFTSPDYPYRVLNNTKKRFYNNQ